MGQVQPQERQIFRIERLGDVDSTNAEALRRAAAGERGPLWISAQRQSAGRGRRGRQWVSEPGNLYASLLFAPGCEAHLAGQIAFVASLALHDAICSLAPAAYDGLKLKWPNDLLLNGAKVAGILIESAGSSGLDLIVTGCGVNCVTHPSDTLYETTDFACAGFDISSDALGTALVETFQYRLQQWSQGRNFPEIRGDWLQRACGIGAPVVIRVADDEFGGIFDRLGHDGRLILRLPDGGQRDILAGDMFMTPPPGSAKDGTA